MLPGEQPKRMFTGTLPDDKFVVTRQAEVTSPCPGVQPTGSWIAGVLGLCLAISLGGNMFALLRCQRKRRSNDIANLVPLVDIVIPRPLPQLVEEEEEEEEEVNNSGMEVGTINNRIF